MKLYLMPGACSLASHIALIWAGADYQVISLSHTDIREDSFRRINPLGAVPVLVLPDGSALTESLAVLQYIAEVKPAVRLGAENTLERARMNERLADLVSNVHKAWAPLFVPGRYVTQQSNEEDARNAALKQLDIHYWRLDDYMRGRDWMLFDRRTVADAYLYVMCSWKDKTPVLLAKFPALDAFKLRLDADEGILRALHEEAPAKAP